MDHAPPWMAPAPRAFGLILALAFASLGAAAAPKAAVHNVEIEGMQFSPAVLEVHVGDTIIWSNKDPFPHTATSEIKGGFDSGEIKPGRKWKLTVTKRGEFPYVCTLHRTMKGQLVVK